MRNRLALAALLCLGLAGCTVGPNYQRPKVNLPGTYRGAPAVAPPQPSPESLGNEKWWKVFNDPVLEQLIHTALKQNYDIQIAATRVLQSEAQVTLTRSNQFPIVQAGGDMFSEKNPKFAKNFPAYSATAGKLDASVIWDLDFWGKFRRQTEAARANLLATEWGERAVMNSVVSSVAAAYFQLRELDLALEIAQNTLKSRQQSLHLTQVLYNNGSASQLDLSQSQELVYTASETIPDLERDIAQQENLIRNLLGANPGAVARGLKLTEQPIPSSIPAGLPSELIERRPDIREAEANLIAANADIGVAKADFLPDFTLTASGGFESYALNRFFSGPSALWNATGTLVQTIFQAGARRAGLKLTRAQKQQMLLSYQATIKGALQQVSDALIAYQKNREFREQQEKLTAAAKNAQDLSNILYEHGGASYLQLLTSETNYFAAELNLAQARLNERLALVQVYNALGGGWQQ